MLLVVMPGAPSSFYSYLFLFLVFEVVTVVWSLPNLLFLIVPFW